MEWKHRILTTGLPGKSLSLFFVLTLAKDLSILFIFFKNQLLVSLIFSFWYSSLYMYKIVISCWSLNCHCISNILHLYSPHDHIAGLDIIFVCGWFPTFTLCLPLPMNFPMCHFLVCSCDLFCLEQQSPTFLAPGTSFVEDSFSTDGGGEMVQEVMRVMGGLVQAVTQAVFQVVMWAMGSGRWSFACSPTAHLLLCGLVPNRPPTGTSPWPGCWVPRA